MQRNQSHVIRVAANSLALIYSEDDEFMDGHFRDQPAALFKDRVDAGQRLAELLNRYKAKEAVVYALPRGGVVLAAEIAKKLGSPLDLIITRKIGHPYSPEYAIGAIAENGHSVFSKKEVSGISKDYLVSESEKQKEEAKRRRGLYVGGKKPVSCTGKIAILVDDGVATGLTIKAAIKELQIHYKPEKIIVAVAVIPWEIAKELEKEGAEVVAAKLDRKFLGSIGAYYQNFAPIEDQDVIKIMKR